MIKIITGLRDPQSGKQTRITLNDLQAIWKTIIPQRAASHEIDHGFGLVVIDPLVSFLPEANVRKVMEDLLNFAQKYNVAVLVNVGKSLKNISSASIASIFYVANNFFDDSKRRFLKQDGSKAWIVGPHRVLSSRFLVYRSV